MRMLIFFMKMADSVVISDEFKDTINDFAKENQIKLHENFWHLEFKER